MEKCPVCYMPASVEEATTAHFKLNCYRCGVFNITREADTILRHNPIEEYSIGTATGYIRRNTGLVITVAEIDRLRVLRTPSVTEKAASLLLAIASEYPQPAMLFSDPAAVCAQAILKLAPFEKETQYPTEAISEFTHWLKWLAISSAGNRGELRWLIHKVLVPQGYLEVNAKQEILGSHPSHLLGLTPSGWVEADRLKGRNRESRTGFVAMSFRPEFIALYDQGIAPGIAAAGYEPLRVDRKEHNNRIDDEIIATIKTSRFLVADFSVDRGGIYFEAGYALGLGLPVIWLVREAEKDAIHFDNRQYNFIRWTPDDYESLKTALKHRIEATIGRGPGVS
jgi:nucleoside 2-deoxyribosyltransferase